MSEPRPRYPFPEDREDMSEQAIGEWYKNRLPHEEFIKFTAFSVVLNKLYGGTVPEAVTITLMNVFHVDPSEPVSITETSVQVDLDPDLVREVYEELMASPESAE